MPEVPTDPYRLAAHRLHHLSMRYSGALLELLGDKPVGMIPQGHPGLREARDLIDLVLFTRAEINALTKLLADANVFTVEAFTTEVTEQYGWFEKEKARFLGVKVSDVGLVFTVGGDGASSN